MPSLCSTLKESENAECWNDLGCAQSACKLYVDAESSFRRAIELDQAYGQAYLNLGLLLVTSAAARKLFLSWIKLAKHSALPGRRQSRN